MGGRSGSRRRNDPEGNRRSEGKAREGSEITSLGSRLRDAGSTWGRFVLVAAETDSTNVLAASLAKRGAPHGSVVVAKSQSAGKGRWGRRWESVEGGLYLSLVIRPEERDEDAGRDLGLLPLTASVAAAEALEESFGISCELRWPNDLFFAGRKLGGILCESSFVGGRCEFAIVGIGVNVNQKAEDFPGELSSRATSLSAILGREMDPLDAALAIVLALEKWWERASGPSALQRWRELAASLAGARVQVTPADGSPYLASVVALADDGGLEVRLDGGTTRVLRSDQVRLSPEPGYYEEVETYFVAKRGSPLFITPSEWDLVWRWDQLGIPVAVVKEGIDRVFDRPKTHLKPRRLSYCRQTVEAAFRKFQEASLGRREPEEKRKDQGAGARLAEIASKLEDLAASEKKRGLSIVFERTMNAVRSLSERGDEATEELERALSALDFSFIGEVEAVLEGAAREELRREAESSLESYRERMPERIYRAAVESAYRRRLRRKLGLPTLSLYA